MAAEENTWGLELARQQNAAERTKKDSPPPGKSGEKVTTTNVITEASQLATSQFVVRPLFIAGFKTFGLTWAVLFLYTLVKDLLNAKFLGDPGDVVFLGKTAKGAMKIPEPVKAGARLGARFFIYPVGGLVFIAVLASLTLMMLPFAVITGLLLYFSNIFGIFG
ncbi:hypothetical protein HY478_03670 [Candidatus Uhrbacteria bacterium]|nr:hypothetical protein [Candidatus Uhrbacteria bacterium]